MESGNHKTTLQRLGALSTPQGFTAISLLFYFLLQHKATASTAATAPLGEALMPEAFDPSLVDPSAELVFEADTALIDFGALSFKSTDPHQDAMTLVTQSLNTPSQSVELASTVPEDDSAAIEPTHAPHHNFEITAATPSTGVEGIEMGMAVSGAGSTTSAGSTGAGSAAVGAAATGDSTLAVTLGVTGAVGAGALAMGSTDDEPKQAEPEEGEEAAADIVMLLTAGFTIAETDSSTSVDETGNTDTFTIVLDARPASNVRFDITSSDTGEATVTSSLTFTNTNWNMPQTATVTGVDDDIIDGAQISTITVAVDDASSDEFVDSVADQTVTATTTDNDVAGFTIVESAGSTSVAETGTTDTFTIVLNAQPASNVVLTVTSNDTGETTVNTPLTFTNANWNTAQTVTVTGVDGHRRINSWTMPRTFSGSSIKRAPNSLRAATTLLGQPQFKLISTQLSPK